MLSKESGLLKQMVNYAVSFAVIMACLWLGNAVQTLLSVSVPGSIFGMLILFALLASGILKVHWVQPGARLFIRYMMILFVPISVGLMEHFPLLQANALAIFASTIGATTIVLVLLGLGLQKFLTKSENKEH